MSIRKISEMTGLSTATVSHAINGTRLVSAKSRSKVLEAAEAIGYKPNMAAKFMRTNKSKTVALIMPGVGLGKPTNYFFMDVMAGVQARLDESGYSLIVTAYDEPFKEDRGFSFGILEKQWIDGILVVPDSAEEGRIAQIMNCGLPFVMIDRKIKGMSHDFVVSDNEKGSYDAVELMYRRGKRKIAFVGSRLKTSASRDRYCGYRKCLTEFGLPDDEGLVLLNDQLSIENGMKSAALLVEKGADGIFVSDNILTIGVFRHLKKQGLRIPEDLSLIGYDDYEWMNDVEPAITAVKQSPYRMGSEAASMLLERLLGPDSGERKFLILDTVLVKRESH
jgi:LacI family transcriptional regulator